MAQNQVLKRLHKTFRPIFPVRKEVGEDPTEFKNHLRRKIVFDLGLPSLKELGAFDVYSGLMPETFASGVAVVQIAKDIQDLLWLRLGERCYDLEIKLGEYRLPGTDECEIVERKDFSHINEELIRRTLPKFVGKIHQTIKKFETTSDSGESESIKKPALCHEIQMKSFEPPLLRLQIRCGAFFIPRVFANELPLELGTVGYARRLHRFSQGPFTYEEALPSYAVSWDNCMKTAAKFADRLRAHNYHTRTSFSEEDLQLYIAEKRLEKIYRKSRRAKSKTADEVAQ